MEWAGMNALTASTWINQPGMFLFSAQLMGGGEIEEIAQSAEKSIKLLVKELDN